MNDRLVLASDVRATLLRLISFDGLRFTVKYKGQDVRLTNVSGQVVKQVDRLTMDPHHRESRFSAGEI